MKLRNGFISNSSSSSFVVFGDTFEEENIPEDTFVQTSLNNYEITLPIVQADKEFGWDIIRYKGILTKLNFAICQVYYTAITNYECENNTIIDFRDKNPCGERESLLRKAIENNFRKTHGENCNLKIIINLALIGGFNGAYIDHGSSAVENKNVEIFDSIEKMEDFLFNANTYIQGNNSNNSFDYKEKKNS